MDALLPRQQLNDNNGNNNTKALHHDKPPLSKPTSGTGRKPLRSIPLNNPVGAIVKNTKKEKATSDSPSKTALSESSTSADGTTAVATTTAPITESSSSTTSPATSLDQQTKAAFRSTVWIDSVSDDEEELWTLKRASPVYDSDDEEFFQYQPPAKRSKTVSLDWQDRMEDQEILPSVSSSSC